MPTHLLAAARPSPWRTLGPCLVLAVVVLAACSTAEPGPGSTTPSPSVSGSTMPATPTPSVRPSPTPAPTPRFTNQPDPQLEALIPARIVGAHVEKPAPSEFGITPGDIGLTFGELGLRFESLAVAFVEKPRLSLFAVRVGGAPVDTATLRPYLAAAGQYVGIHGLHLEAWRATIVAGKRVWRRGDDAATLPGTTLYCWSAGQYVFLLTGSSDAANRAMLKALPGQPAPTPTPRPSPTPRASANPSGAGASTPATSSPPAAS
ncbi:MAG: hypothetical protein E6J50_04530 [Chloroflexi bacterium]|nr:MAG: hypothetical protein E6J50_04530 [Chloroflexota bacterium]